MSSAGDARAAERGVLSQLKLKLGAHVWMPVRLPAAVSVPEEDAGSSSFTSGGNAEVPLQRRWPGKESCDTAPAHRDQISET